MVLLKGYDPSSADQDKTEATTQEEEKIDASEDEEILASSSGDEGAKAHQSAGVDADAGADADADADVYGPEYLLNQLWKAEALSPIASLQLTRMSDTPTLSEAYWQHRYITSSLHAAVACLEAQREAARHLGFDENDSDDSDESIIADEDMINEVVQTMQADESIPIENCLANSTPLDPKIDEQTATHIAPIIRSRNNRKAARKAETQSSSKESSPQKAKSKAATTSKATPKGVIPRTIQDSLYSSQTCFIEEAVLWYKEML